MVADAGRDGPPLLSVADLTAVYRTGGDPVTAVDGVSFDLAAGETVGLVGESGAGKTALVRSLVGLLDDPGAVVGGAVRWRGEDLLSAGAERRRAIRGAGIGMAFQDASAAFDPTETVGAQVAEAVAAQADHGRGAARERAVELLGEVGIPAPHDFAGRYPHELSGGLAQRALIAMALAGDPDLLIADEPTTGLDVSTQATMLDLFDRLAAERGMALLFVSHDLGAVSELCDRVLVMYAGGLVERGTLAAVVGDPKHPYTQSLLASVPDVDAAEPARPIQGDPPDLADPPTGCRFHPRCPLAKPRCRDPPPRVSFDDGSDATCHAYTDAYGALPADTGGLDLSTDAAVEAVDGAAGPDGADPWGERDG
ncbi:MAG: ABC transporter ATP-binding protein [Halobacteriaceae archaeon]